MNYDDKQPMHNGSEIGLIDLGVMKKPKHKQASKRESGLTRTQEAAAWVIFSYMKKQKQPLSVKCDKELKELFETSRASISFAFNLLHNSPEYKKGLEESDCYYDLEGNETIKR